METYLNFSTRLYGLVLKQRENVTILPLAIANRLTDGGKVVSPTRRPPFTPQEDSWYSFLLETESTPGP
jgi:hypothetical protein